MNYAAAAQRVRRPARVLPAIAMQQQAQQWDQCMEDALKYGLGEAAGSERVRYCDYYYRNPKRWWEFWR